MKLHLVISLLVSFVASITAEQCGNTSLHCAKPEITCKEGPADFSFHPKDFYGEEFVFLKTKERTGYHCDCPAGLTGLRCARSYERCEGNGHFCYHGGKCIQGLNSSDPNELFCDCTNAQHNGIPYAGKFCQVELEKCAHNTEVFCASGGQCKEDFEDKLRPCVCPQGKRGPHCEFDDGHVPECKLECQNNGECTRGVKQYSQAIYNNFWASHDGNFQYCACKEGFYGLECEAEAQSCGGAECFHGGTCVQTLNSKNETVFACDCNTAKKGGNSYAGQYCQSKATNYCSKDKDANGQLFCANNGDCQDEAHLGCDCEGGYHGPSCEHAPEIPKDQVDECSLQCRNGGKCRAGAKDTSMFSQFGADLDKYNMTHINWEHCVCPDGFFGIMCEHQLDMCPGGEHVCLHGSKCVAVNETDPDGADHVCDCEQGFNALEKFAGKFCQYESTDICTKDGKPGVSKANFAFCVNNGKCKSRVDNNRQSHPGCECPEGFKGDHCEFLEGTESKSSTSTVTVQSGIDNQKMNMLIALAAILVVGIGLVSALLCKRNKKIEDLKEKDASVANANSEAAETAGSFENGDPKMEEVEDYSKLPEKKKQQEEEGMKTVEII